MMYDLHLLPSHDVSVCDVNDDELYLLMSESTNLFYMHRRTQEHWKVS